MNGLKRAVAIFGTQVALARAIDRHYQEISAWLKAGQVPMKHCAAIARAVAGEIPLALARGVPPDVARAIECHELNPHFPAPAELAP
jgi:DNA-binding transcriptional regulator YdaS (Cro superfamily)